MKTKHLLAFALLFSILAFGQAGCLPGGEQSQAATIGLDFALLQDAPQSTIVPGTEFQVGVKIENHGEVATIGEFCVEDTIDDVYGGISKECEFFSIREASVENGKILPRVEVKMFPSFSSSFKYNNIEDQAVSIVSTLTYGYSTKANPIACVKNPLKQLAVNCPTSENLPVNVKAPLGISRIEKTINPAGDTQVRLNVKIYLKKRVDGTLLSHLQGSNFGDNARNKVLLRTVAFGNTDLNCNLESDIIEIRTEKVLSCSGLVNLNRPDSIITNPLNIQLDYAVEIQKVKRVNIVEK